MVILKFDEFVRSLKQNRDTTHSLLLGAGASVESGIPSATDCIWDWKSEIFLSQNPALIDSYRNNRVDYVRLAIQKWLDDQGVYPMNNSEEEYSFYAEKAYPINDDRRKYFQHIVEGKTPSIGYHLISMLSEQGWVKSVWTTNFDGLMLKCAHQYNITPIEITLETVNRIFRNDVDRELLCIALHGDYKYGSLKNTSAELDSQNEVFVNAMKHELLKRNLIVIGYSGRDKSIMNALQKVYEQPGGGRLYWCGYGANYNPAVEALINTANSNGRTAYYIPTDGFDKTVLSIAQHCMSEDALFLRKIDALKNQLGAATSLGKSKFFAVTGTSSKIIDTNIYPISFPTSCYQFQVKLNNQEKPWDYCKSLAAYDIIAVPMKGLIYAWGDKQSIYDICSNKLISEIRITPFTREAVIKTGVFKELLLRAFTTIIGQSCSLLHNKNTVWDPNSKVEYQIGNRIITAFKGIRLSLLFDWKFKYVTFTPTFVYENNLKLSRAERKQFSDNYSLEINNRKPNPMIYNYLREWTQRILGADGIQSSFPIDSNGFRFIIRPASAFLGINTNSSNSKVKLPTTVNEKRIVLQGVECRDPELVFYNYEQNTTVKDFHPMRGLINNKPFDYALNEKVLRPSILLGVLCPKAHGEKFYSFLSKLNSRHVVKYNVDYVIPFPGFHSAFKTGLNISVQGSNEWIALESPLSSDLRKAAHELGIMINRKLDQLSATQIDVALIYIPKEYEPLTAFSDENGKFDLHDFVKAYAAQKIIATQFVREKTLESDMECQIMWALSLAIYVKSCRIPWTISGINNDTAFAGIGYSVNHSSTSSHTIVGCSHIYSSDGQGVKYKLSKINDVTLDRKANPYLSEEEAFRLGLNIKELFYKSFTDLPKRVVIHKRTPFRNEEVKGLTECLLSAGIRDIELLEITYEDSLKCFALKNDFEIDGFPVRRGLCFPINDNTMYLYTHGIAPSVRNPKFKYIQGGKTIPLPLKIVKYYGYGSMTQIAMEILGLSKMNWNSFGLYSKLPCTIESSNEIARIGWLLSQYEGSVYDYRYFM